MQLIKENANGWCSDMMRLATELAGRHCFWGAGPMARLQSLAELLERAMERERERERQKNTGNVWTCIPHLENYGNALKCIYIYIYLFEM